MLGASQWGFDTRYLLETVAHDEIAAAAAVAADNMATMERCRIAAAVAAAVEAALADIADSSRPHSASRRFATAAAVDSAPGHLVLA